MRALFRVSPRLRKVARYFSFCLMVAAAILAVAIVASLTIDLGPAARATAEQQATTYIERPVRIGRLSIHLLSGKFVVEDLSIAGIHDGDRPFFTAKRLAVAMDWTTAMQRKPEFMITSVEMTDWQMLVEHWNGAHNFPKFKRQSEEPEGPKRFTTTLKYLRASRGQFVYEDHEAPWSIVCPNLDIDITNLPNYHGDAVFDGGTLRIENFKPMPLTMRARFTLNGPRVHLPRIDFESEGATIVARGDVDMGHWPNQSYLFDADFGFGPMRDIFFADQDWQMAGRGHFTGSFAMADGGDHLDRELKGAFNSDRLAWNGYDFPALGGSLRWTPDSFDIWDGKAQPFGGEAAFTYSIKPLGRPQPAVSRFAADYRGVDLTVVSDHEGWRGTRLAGTASGRHELEWLMGHFAERTNEGHFMATPGEIAPMTASLAEAPPGPLRPFAGAMQKHPPIAADIAYRSTATQIEFGPSHFATEGTYVAFEGATAWGDSSRLAFHVTSRDFQESDRLLAGVINDFGGATEPVTFGGRGEFDGVMTGPFRRARVEGTFSGQDLRAFDTLWGDGTGRIRYENGYIAVTDGIVRRGDSEIRTDGIFSTDAPREDGGDEIDARFRVTRRDVESLRHAFDADDYPITGVLSGDVHVSGLRARPVGFGALTLEQAVAWSEPIDTATAALRLDGTGVRLDDVKASKGAGTVTGAAFIGWDSTYSFDVTGRVPVDQIALLAVENVPLSGAADFTARGSGTFDTPRNDIRFRVADFTIAKEQLGQLTGDLAMRGSDLTGQIDVASPTLAITGAGRIRLTAAHEADVSLRFHEAALHPWLLAYTHALSPNTTAVASGTIHVVGPLGDRERLSAEAVIDSIDLHLFDYALRNDGPIRLVLERGDVSVRDLRLVGDDTSLSVTGTVGLERQTVALQVAGGANLGVLQGLFRDVRGSGRAEVTAGINGPLRQPLFSGSATITDGRIRHFSLPNALDSINGTINFDERGVRLDGVTATMGGGPVQFGGRIGFDGYAPSDVNVTAHGENMQLRLVEGLRSSIDADVTVHGNPSALTVGGTVMVRKALWTRQLEDPTNILEIVRRLTASAGSGTGVVLAADEGRTVPIRYDVRIVVPSTFTADTRLLRLTANADVTLQGTYDRPVLVGHADVENGFVTWEGRRYRITRGAVDFNNPARIEPFFDFEAETNVRVPAISGSVAQNYRVTVGFAGPSDKGAFAVNSDPPLPAADVVALLLSEVRRTDVAELRERQNPNQAQTDILTARAAQALASPISSQVGKVVEQTFGVDTFQLTPSFVDPFGQQTSRLNPTARLTIGKRVSDRVYLTFSRSLGTTINDQIVLLEYEQNDRLSWVLSRNEDQQTYAIEFRVRQSF